MRTKSVRFNAALPSFHDIAADFWSSVEKIDTARSNKDLSAASGEFCKRLGFANFGYATRTLAQDTGDYEYFHNFAGPYGQYRYERVYRTEPEKDPVLTHLRTGRPAAAFSCRDGIEVQRAAKHDYTKILHDAADHGIRAGIGVPIAAKHLRWGFMLLTTADTDRVQDVRNFLPHLCLFTHYLFCKAQRLTAPATPLPVLSQREHDVVQWASIGKTSWEIARILCISESTVNFHLANAAKRLGTTGRRATCARAVALGLISF